MTTSIAEPERIETGFLDGFIGASGAIVDAREYNLLLKTHLERFLTDADNVTVSTNVAALDRARSNDPDVIWLDQFTMPRALCAALLAVIPAVALSQVHPTDTTAQYLGTFTASAILRHGGTQMRTIPDLDGRDQLGSLPSVG